MTHIQIDYNDPTIDWNSPITCYNGGCPDVVDLKVKGGGSRGLIKISQKPKPPPDECDILLGIKLYRVNGKAQQLDDVHKKINPVCYKELPRPATFTIENVRLTNSENQNIVVSGSFIKTTKKKTDKGL